MSNHLKHAGFANILLLIFILPLSSISMAQDAKYDDIPVTRWIDSEGRQPITFEEWKQSIGETAPFSARSAGYFPGDRDGEQVCIIVNDGIYSGIATSLTQYITDLNNDGYTAEIVLTSGGTPEDIRSLLQGKYALGMEGCVIIGDLPVPWYESECWDGPDHEEFPCDLYYMDLDGDFGDDDTDGLYDSHTGDTQPEIWTGRLTAGNLTLDGADEVSLLNNYFNKNHLYRTGQLTANQQALVYVDDDWIPWAGTWSNNVGLAYGTRTLVDDGATTIHSDYEARLPNGYEFIQLCAHSSPYQHHFKIGDEWTGGTTSNAEIKSIDPVALFYNLFACSNARYVQSNYMAGWYTFCDTYGLAAIGSTKTGSMLDFEYFYEPFGNGATIGEAFRDWFAYITNGGASDYQICWHYGMTLIGDPTLRKMDIHLAISTSYVPDGIVGNEYSYQLDANGGTGTLTWSDKYGDLDGTGLTLSSSGTLSGTPVTTGPITFTAEVIDEAMETDEKELSFTIHEVLEITTTTLPDWTVNQPYLQVLEATGGIGDYYWVEQSNDLSGWGLALDFASGEISGTPTAEGLVDFSVVVYDNYGSMDFQDLEFTINPAVAITTESLPEGYTEQEYSLQLQASGGTGELTWTDKYNDLESTGLTLSTEGLLSGIPVEEITIEFTAETSDITGSTDSRLFSLLINPGYICGDVDDDELINILDIVFLLSLIHI